VRWFAICVVVWAVELIFGNTDAMVNFAAMSKKKETSALVTDWRSRWQYPLVPLSWMYGFVVSVRNLLFELKLFRSVRFDVPIIVVGNLTVGGTGKTPHTEYLIRLCNNHTIAVLSRGYNRKSKGFMLADENSTPAVLGDEPFQMSRKFPRVHCAVDADRRNGIRRLLKLFPKLELIVLDDAYQHRYVSPKLSVLLVDFNRPVFDDRMLPAGNLRESMSGLKRADVIVVTKTPHDVKPIDKNIFAQNLHVFPYQKVFFSTYAYGNLIPVLDAAMPTIEKQAFELEGYEIVLLTGIASTQSLVEYLTRFAKKLVQLPFPDHHWFGKRDLEQALEAMRYFEGNKRMIVTTEKDAVKITEIQNLPNELRRYLYYLPIEVEFLDNQEDFDQIVRNTI
jgi:tetraacyldisaccharide 4'-kinase